MLIQSIYPVYAILGGGLGCYYLLQRWFRFKWRKTEIFHFSLMTSSFILIIPWVFIGIQPNGILVLPIVESFVFTISFDWYVIACYGTLLILGLYASFHLVKLFIQKFEDLESINLRESTTLNIVLILLLLGEYLLLQLVLPLRGFDALYYYFPEAEVFYFSDKITEINYLSFSPIVKAPLNVMLYTFSLYISNLQTYQLYPFLFLIGSTILVYDLSIELWGEKIKAQLAMLVFMVTPVVYWTMMFWAFYQDLYVCYFFGAAFYFVWKGTRADSQHSKAFIILAIMSMALALLSKITAWALFAVLIFTLPTKRLGKVFQLLLLIGLTVFLIARAITNIFIGVGFVILLVAALIGYFITKRPSSEENLSFFSLISFFFGSLIFGGFWIIDRINKSNEFLNSLISLYFTVNDSIVWEFNDSPIFTLETSLERMHGVNFLSSAFFFFIGIAFCLPWIISKIMGLIRGTEISFITIWVLSFYMIWTAYYFQGSIRYLSPIYIPFAILIVHGLHSLLQHFNLSLDTQLPRAMLVFFGCVNFYFLIPLDFVILGENSQEIVGNAYNKSAFSFYSQPVFAFIQAVFFTLIWIIMMIIASETPVKLPFSSLTINFISVNYFRRIRTVLTFMFVLAVSTIPIAVQGYVWLQSSGDLSSFQGTMEYEYNEDYQAVVDQINLRGSLGAIITVRTPGLQFFTHHPTLDFYYQDALLGTEFYSSQNISYLIELLKHPNRYLLPPEYNQAFVNELSFEYIIVPNVKNIYFDLYKENIWSKVPLFRSLENTTFFDQIFENDRYRVFKII